MRVSVPMQIWIKIIELENIHIPVQARYQNALQMVMICLICSEMSENTWKVIPHQVPLLEKSNISLAVAPTLVQENLMTIQLSDLMTCRAEQSLFELWAEGPADGISPAVGFRCFNQKPSNSIFRDRFCLPGLMKTMLKAFDLLAFRSGRSREMWL